MLSKCENINEVELCVLNILLTHAEKQGFIIENLDKAFFTDSTNQQIFQTARELFVKGEEIDNVIIYDRLRKPSVDTRLTEILLDSMAISPLTTRYCKILFNNYLETLIANAKNNDDFDKINDLKQHYLFDDSSKIMHISDNVENFEENYLKKQNTMLLTGYNQLDDYIGSFMGGDYIALGGSTGTGKTSVALNLARQFCMQDKTVLYFSLEMTLEQLQNRFNCMTQGLNALKYRSCGFNLEELTRYKEGLKQLKQWKLNIVTDYNLTVEKMKIYMQEQAKKKLDFVILDYLGLVQGYNNKSLYEKSTMLSRKIKLLATEFNVPILVLVQLNRDLKNRNDKRPVLSDIRESGAIEQDADFVLFAHREGVYNADVSPENLEIIIAKNRHGSNNQIARLQFHLETQEITEI